MFLFTLTFLTMQTEKVAFSFNDKPYVHRHHEGNMDEYTPKGQSDLEKWTDMMTVNRYDHVKNGEQLATAANSVLETYEKHKAMVVRTTSVPRTEKKPAEHLIVVLFPQPKYIEAAFARFRMSGDAGYSLVYSHRMYGEKIGDAMSTWLKKNGPIIEKKLMSWPSVPKSPK